MTPPTVIGAARTALRAAMERDPRIMVIGEDVGTGGPFGLTKGIAERFGVDRVRNTPISEGAIMGAGVGLALGGKRPFIDLMFDDFLTLMSDELFNHAAKINFMSGGRYSVPLTLWTTGGGGSSWGAQHSQRLDGWLASVPGLKVLVPSTPSATADAVTAALEDPDPVVILADRTTLYSRQDLPGGSPWTPRVVREGADLTIVATGRLLHLALQAAHESASDAEVIDLQRLAPLDVTLILGSVAKTGRLLVLHDEARSGGMSARILAAVAEAAQVAPRMRRLTSADTPVPAAPSLEEQHRISLDDVVRAIRALTAADESSPVLKGRNT